MRHAVLIATTLYSIVGVGETFKGNLAIDRPFGFGGCGLVPELAYQVLDLFGTFGTFFDLEIRTHSRTLEYHAVISSLTTTPALFLR